MPARFASGGEGASADPAAFDDWVASFGDPILSSLVEEAQRHNPDLRRAAAVWREAQARVRVARSHLLPQIDGAAGVSRSRSVFGDTPSTETRSEVAAAVSWEVDLWGRLRSGEEAAVSAAEAVRLDYDFARQSLAASVADAWFTAIEARQRLAIALDQLEAEERTARVTRDKTDAGVGTQLDAEIAEANVALAQANVTASRSAIAELTKALEALIGRYPAAELEVAEDLPGFPGPILVGVPSDLLERRPDVAAANRRIAAAFHLTEEAKAARLPRIILTGSLGALLDPGHALWSIGANLLGPIFTGGRLEAEVEIASAQQEQAIAGYVGTAIEAFREVESALGNEQYLARREIELQGATERMRAASRIGEDRYDAGVLSIIDLTAIRRQDFASRIDLLGVRTDRLRQRLTLHRALGGSFDGGADVERAAGSPANPQPSAQPQSISPERSS